MRWMEWAQVGEGLRGAGSRFAIAPSKDSGTRRPGKKARLAFTGMACVCVAGIACGDTPSAPQLTVQLELVGVDTFRIQDTDVNPGCHYGWVMRATGDVSARAELVSGRILSSWDLDAVPVDTMYHWTDQTIKPLFGGSAEFRAGQQRESGPYATVSSSLPSFRMRTEFDYVVFPGGSQHVVSREYYCIRE